MSAKTPNPKKLFEVKITAYKIFYVEAATEDDAWDHPAIEEESDPGWTGDFNWEFDCADLREVDPEDAEHTRKRCSKLIAKNV